MYKLPKREIMQAQCVLLIAIGLQLVAWNVNGQVFTWPQLLIVITEFMLVLTIGFTINRKTFHERSIHHTAALVLLGAISAANFMSLILVLQDLIIVHSGVGGMQLLMAALAIFMTNIIVFSLWYWEIDSPGLTRKRWSKNDKDFHFTQQDMKGQFPEWKPEYMDYLYLSLTNAINFAPADTKPVTHSAKLLMGSQALVSVFTLALVLARAVNILN
jgi:uncharacterized membrane protein